MARVTFEAELRPSGRGGGGHLVEVPAKVVAELGGKGRIPVNAWFDGVPYRGSIVKMGGMTMLGVTKAIMSEANVSTGDTLSVIVENDDAPREVEVPEDLAKALGRSKGTKTAWDKLPFTHKREYVEVIVEAKKPETRARQIDKAIEALLERARAK